MISNYITADVPVLLWGAPGTGKTAHITALAEEKGAHLETLIGSTMDPTDLGRPIIKGDDVLLAPPPWVKRLREALDSNKPAWLFLDELTCAPPAVQAALLRVVNERIAADVSLEGCRVIAAANPPHLSASGLDLSAATNNRWAHIQWETDVDNWVAGETSGWGNPDPALAEIRGVIAGWVTSRPDTLLDPPEDGQESQTWPSPRSWSNCIRALGTLPGSAVDIVKSRDGRQVVSSLVGHAMAAELSAYVADTTLPTPEELLAGTKPIPKRGDRQTLVMSMVISYVVNKGGQDRLWALCRDMRQDLAVVTTRRATWAIQSAGQEIEYTPDYAELCKEYRELA